MSFDWKGTIGKVAPGIATMLGGPLAGMATNALCDMFGIKSDAPDAEAQIERAVRDMTPDQAIKMREVENNLKIQLKKIDVDIFEAEVSDRKSARVSHAKAYTPSVLTYLLVVCAGIIVYFVFTSGFDGVDKTLVGTVIGYVFSELKQATSFWLGSSFGSREKTNGLVNGMRDR